MSLTGLVIKKIKSPRLLTPAWVASIRSVGMLNQTERLTVCRACGCPILIGELRISGRFGYKGGLTAHVHQECPKAKKVKASKSVARGVNAEC